MMADDDSPEVASDEAALVTAGTRAPATSRRSRFARWLVRRAGYSMHGSLPKRGLVVGAPHTSNWDFVAAVLIFWADDASPRVLVKRELFWWPLGPLLRALGAIETDRGAGAALIRQLIADAEQDDEFIIVIAPDGTRKATDHWKSGFYRLAMATGLPVALAYADGPSKSFGIGPRLLMTGDVRADMDKIRAFFSDKHGFRPGYASAVRLRDESKPRP